MVRVLLYSFCVLICLPAALAEPSLCQEPNKAVCAPRIPNQIHAEAKRLSLQAARAVNEYLGENYALEDYAETLKKELSELPKPPGLKSKDRTIARTILYMGCADRLARAGFAQDLNPPPCFPNPFVPKSANPSLQEIVAPVAESLNYPQVDALLRDSKYWVIEALKQGKFSPEVKAALVNRVEQTGRRSLVNYLVSNIMSADTHEMETQPDKLLDKLNDCDFDQKTLNAFSLANGESIVLVVCPGLWVTAMQSHQFSQSNRALLSLMHEYGHSVEGAVSDWKTGAPKGDLNLMRASKQSYQRIVSCMQKTQVSPGRLFTYIPGSPGEAEHDEFVKKMDFKVERKIPDVFFAEYSADLVSAKAFALFMANLPANERVQTLKECLDDYCEIMEHETLTSPFLSENLLHPSDPFRLEQIIMSTPEIRNALGCSTQSAQTSCAFF